MPKASVIIPTYNRADLLPQALESVFAQTFQDFEIIVVDDGSTDPTASLMEGYRRRWGDKVRYRAVSHVGQLGVLRNKGLDIARGEYVALLDSDDVWMPSKLQRQVAVLNDNPGVGLVSSNAQVLDGDTGEIVGRYLRPGQGRSGAVLADLVRDNFAVLPTVMIRRSVLQRTGPFGCDPLLRGIEDYDLWLRIAALAEVRYLEEPLAVYRDHAGSMRRGCEMTTYWRGQLLIIERLRRFLTDQGLLDHPLARLLDQREWAIRREIINLLRAAGRSADARRCFREFLARKPVYGAAVLLRHGAYWITSPARRILSRHSLFKALAACPPLARMVLFLARPSDRLYLALATGAGQSRAVTQRLWTVRRGPLAGFRLTGLLPGEIRPVLRQEMEPSCCGLLERLPLESAAAIDVGGSYGFYALLLSRRVGPGGSVYCLEPDSAGFRRLTNNLSLNGARNVTALPLCALDANGAAPWTSARNEPWRGQVAAEAQAEGATVPTVTLDTLAAEQGILRAVRFIKIDVEGAEARVLRGMLRLLAESHPLILCEIHGEALSREVFGLLEKADYPWRTIAYAGPDRRHVFAFPRSEAERYRDVRDVLAPDAG